MVSRTDKSRTQPYSMLFLSTSGGSLWWKGRFYRQEAPVLASRNGGFWNWFAFLSASKVYIALIINVFNVMPQNSVFRCRTTTRLQILAVFVVRTAFMLILFTASGNTCKDDISLMEGCRRREAKPTNMPLLCTHVASANRCRVEVKSKPWKHEYLSNTKYRYRQLTV